MKKKMIVDIAMTVLLPCLMAYSLISETLHEFGGLAMFALFITHHVLNRGWFASLRRGRYDALRTVNTALDLMLLLDMLCMMISGILISKHALSFLGITKGASIGRILHMLGAYWGYVLMSLHLGFHGKVMASRMGVYKNKTLCVILRILFAAVSLYGIWAFAKRQFPAYMFLQQLFVFFDTGEPLILFFLDYLAIMILFAVLGYYGMKALQLAGQSEKRRQKEAEKGEDPETEKKQHKKKRRRIILAVLGAVILIAGLVWGIPYVRRHFVTVKIDRTQATAIAPVDLGGKTLTVYFSRTGNSNFEPDVDAVSSASLMLDETGRLVGNAELLAEMVQKSTGGDIHAIRVAEGSRYPSSYGDTVSVAGDELNAADLPKLDETVSQPDLASYDNIILIYPIWWWTVPKPVEAWLAQADLSGREVYLVVTHGGSGAGNCPKDMAPMLRGGTVNENVLTVYDDDADEAADQVYTWLKSLK